MRQFVLMMMLVVPIYSQSNNYLIKLFSQQADELTVPDIEITQQNREILQTLTDSLYNASQSNLEQIQLIAGAYPEWGTGSIEIDSANPLFQAQQKEVGGIACIARQTPPIESVLEPGGPDTSDSLFPFKTESSQSPIYWAIKNNALYDAVALPNFGIELYVGKRWSVAGGWYFSWWSNDAKQHFYHRNGGHLEVRKWFGKSSKQGPLQGHHVGVYLQAMTFDFARNGKGYLSDKWNYGAGISYGYSLSLSRRLKVDFSIGIGTLKGRYQEYRFEDGEYVWQATKRRLWWGPTKDEISFVWILGGGK